jgi:hypothetical protein
MDEASPNTNPFGELMIYYQPIFYVNPLLDVNNLLKIVEEDSGNVSRDSMASRANYKDFNSSDEGELSDKDRHANKEESVVE